MKKGFLTVGIVVLILLLYFWKYPLEPKREGETVTKEHTQTESTELCGVWFTCYEIAELTENKTAAQYSETISQIAKQMKENGYNTAFYQARGFSDALYISSYFPVSKYIGSSLDGKNPYDPFELFIEKMNGQGIAVHAWVNPFRVSFDSDINKLPDGSPAKQWYQSNKKTTAVFVCEKGIYYNPADETVRKLLLNGIREIFEKYNIDGIHFDDYFYPDCTVKDNALYQKYQKAGGILSKDDWRRENVSQFVASVKVLVNHYGKVFGISPSADIVYNTEKIYADVTLWCKEDGYADYIMPQIYYGFENERMPFSKVLNEWCEMVTNTNVKLYVGLAAYKNGKADAYAGKGKNEWLNHDDIIDRQQEEIQKNGSVSGF